MLEGIWRTFGDVSEGEPVALVDSTGFVAIAVRNGSAALSMELDIGTPIALWPVSVGGDTMSAME